MSQASIYRFLIQCLTYALVHPISLKWPYSLSSTGGEDKDFYTIVFFQPDIRSLGPGYNIIVDGYGYFVGIAPHGSQEPGNRVFTVMLIIIAIHYQLHCSPSYADLSHVQIVRQPYTVYPGCFPVESGVLEKRIQKRNTLRR